MTATRNVLEVFAVLQRTLLRGVSLRATGTPLVRLKPVPNGRLSLNQIHDKEIL
jgi:hypothetical protein